MSGPSSETIRVAFDTTLLDHGTPIPVHVDLQSSHVLSGLFDRRFSRFTGLMGVSTPPCVSRFLSTSSYLATKFLTSARRCITTAS